MRNKHTSQFDLYVSLQLKNLSAEIATALKNTLGKVRDVLAECENECIRLRDSNDYSAEGLRRQYGRVRQAGQERLREIEAADIAKLKANIASLRAQLAPKQREGDPILNALKDREVRDYIRARFGTDRLAIEAFYAGADDEDVIAAIEGAPKAFAMVRPDVINNQRTARIRKSNPDLAAKLEDAETIEHVISSAVADVGRRLPQIEG